MTAAVTAAVREGTRVAVSAIFDCYALASNPAPGSCRKSLWLRAVVEVATRKRLIERAEIDWSPVWHRLLLRPGDRIFLTATFQICPRRNVFTLSNPECVWINRD